MKPYPPTFSRGPGPLHLHPGRAHGPLQGHQPPQGPGQGRPRRQGLQEEVLARHRRPQGRLQPQEEVEQPEEVCLRPGRM